MVGYERNSSGISVVVIAVLRTLLVTTVLIADEIAACRLVRRGS
jgi:hypothetical protein